METVPSAEKAGGDWKEDVATRSVREPEVEEEEQSHGQTVASGYSCSRRGGWCVGVSNNAEEGVVVCVEGLGG